MPVTPARLRTLTGSTSLDADLSFFIELGQLVLTEFVMNSEYSDRLTTNMQESIVLMLSGHYVVLSEENGGLTYSRTGQSEERYKSFGFDAHGFMSTRFGMMACTLDLTNTLKNMGKKDRVVFDVESYSAKRNAQIARDSTDGI
jgi:hypothetical protein